MVGVVVWVNAPEYEHAVRARVEATANGYIMVTMLGTDKMVMLHTRCVVGIEWDEHNSTHWSPASVVFNRSE